MYFNKYKVHDNNKTRGRGCNPFSLGCLSNTSGVKKGLSACLNVSHTVGSYSYQNIYSCFNICYSFHDDFFFNNSQLDVPKYATPFGPVVDRLIVPNEPLALMSDSNPSNSFFRYDVMMGLTEIEAFHLFPASTGEKLSPAFPCFFEKKEKWN